jgi:outer membrane protein TolC
MRAAVREARARVGVEGALEDPMVAVMVAPQSFGRPEPAGYRIDVDQPIPWFGTRGLRREAAAAEADARQASFETARLDLIREARAAFYDDYHYDQVRRTLLDQLELVRQSRQVALSRYAAGTGAQQDVSTPTSTSRCSSTRRSRRAAARRSSRRGCARCSISTR